MANQDLAKEFVRLFGTLQPEALAAAQAALHAEVVARRPNFDIAEIKNDMAPERRQAFAGEILRIYREAQA